MHQNTTISNIYSPQNEAEIRSYLATPAQSQRQEKSRKLMIYDEFFSTPLLYMVFDFVSTGIFDRDYEIFRTTSIIFFFIGLICIGTAFGLSFFRFTVLILIVSFFFWPTRFDIRVGNISQIQLGLTGLLLISLQRKIPVAAGGLLAFMTLLKPNVILVPFYLFLYWFFNASDKRLFAKQWVSALLTTIVIILATTLYWGSYCSWWNWGSHFLIDTVIHNYMAKAFMSTNLDRHAFHHKYFLSVIVFVYSAIILFLSRKNRNLPNMDNILVVLGLAIYLVAGPLVQVQYYVLAIPLIFWIFRPLIRPWKSIGYYFGLLGTILIAVGPKNNFFGLEDAARLFLGVCILVTIVTIDLIKVGLISARK